MSQKFSVDGTNERPRRTRKLKGVDRAGATPAPQVERRKRADIERLITDLAASLAEASASDLDDRINVALEEIGPFIGADRAFLYQFEDAGRTLRHTHFWASEGSSVPEGIFEVNVAETLPWVAREIREGRVIVASGGFEKARFPEEVKEWLKSSGVTSGAVIPIFVGDEATGALGLDTTGPPRTYADELMQRLVLFANVLGLTIRRVQKETSLAGSEEQFRSFMDNNPAHVYIKGGDLRHLYANRTLLNDLGMSLEKFAGTSSHDFFPSETAERIEAADRLILSGESRTEIFDFPMVVKGEARWFQEVKFALGGPGGERRIGGIAVNVTDRKKVETDLKAAFREIKELKERLEMENVLLREEVELSQTHAEIVGRSAPMKAVLSQVEQVAATDSTVLITGETGTGKELIARQIHKLSKRGKTSLVKVNCAALPPTLIESELFGREKGAFTGAMAKQMGRFEFADGGTIFLDEVGELPLELQVKLLRVLQDGEFERLGSPRTLRVDVRVIAATNRDLQTAVQEGLFREDLFYRLNIFPIQIPPLRERREDIPPLVWFFAQEFWASMGKRPLQISRKTMEALGAHSWQGNARELRNVLERAVILSKGPILNVDLPETKMQADFGILTLEESEKKHIREALAVTGGRVFGEKGAAKLLGINPKTLYSRMKKLGVTRTS